ncbi:unnamed protein product [Camellia sinensis]
MLLCKVTLASSDWLKEREIEIAMEVEDDVFLADLNKQVSLLIMDDDENQVNHCPSVSLQCLHYSKLCSSISSVIITFYSANLRMREQRD